VNTLRKENKVRKKKGIEGKIGERSKRKTRNK
jgi:hypothetical protein